MSKNNQGAIILDWRDVNRILKKVRDYIGEERVGMKLGIRESLGF